MPGGWLADIPDLGSDGNNKGDQMVALVSWDGSAGLALNVTLYCRSVLRLGAPKFTRLAWECSKYCDQKSPSASMVLPER